MKDRAVIKIFPSGCIRVASTPIETFFEWSEKTRVDVRAGEDFLLDFFSRPGNNAALRIASASLWERHRQVMGASAPEAENRSRLAASLASYFSRMCTRTTPFGTFAAVGPTSVGPQFGVSIPGRSVWRAETRLDAQVLFAIVRMAERRFRGSPKLRYRLNTSATRLGDQFRYYETSQNAAGATVHSLASVTCDEPFLAVYDLMSNSGWLTAPELAQGLIDRFGEQYAEVIEGFVLQLIEAQVLVSELVLPVTVDQDPVTWLRERFRQLDGGDASWMAALDLRRAQFDSGEAVERAVDRVREALGGVTIDPPKHTLQVDAYLPDTPFVVGAHLEQDIGEALHVARIFGAPAPHTALEKFKEDFSGRYGNRFLPILEVLDEESGLGFNAAAKPDVGLLDGIDWVLNGASKSSTTLSSILCAVLGAPGGPEEVDLAPIVHSLPAPAAERLPELSSTIVQVHATDEAALHRGDYLCEVGGGGASGAFLLARFALGSERLRDTVDAIARREQERCEPLIAELVYQPAERMTNVSLRPPMRALQIELLAQAGGADSTKIGLADVLLGVLGDRLVLWSKSLAREIVVRHTTAYNTDLGTNLGVFQFLCALQWQGRSMALGLPDVTPSCEGRVPRFVYRRLVLARAKWNISEKSLNAVRGASDALQALNDLRERLKLPRFVLFGTGDNRIVFDFENTISVRDFLKRARASIVTVEEAFPRGRVPWLRSPDGRHAAEFVVPVERRAAPIAVEKVSPKAVVTGTRRSCPGSEWTSIKIYTGTVSREQVIRRVLPRVIGALPANAEWFFLRYADPKPHLRFRVRNYLDGVLSSVWETLVDVLGDASIHRLDVDTYVPEALRYGGDESMPFIERIFCVDSKIALSELSRRAMTTRERADYCCASVAAYFELFGVEVGRRQALLREMASDMYAILNVSGKTRAAVGQRYREERPHVAAAHRAWRTTFGALETECSADARVLRRLDAEGVLTVPLDSVVRSLIHMSLNRVLTTYSREQEAMVYDFLHRAQMEVNARRAVTPVDRATNAS